MANHSDGPAVPPAALAQLDEIAAGQPATLSGRSVRVLGRISDCQPIARTLLLKYRGASLVVDTSLLDEASPLLAPGAFQQFLGELVVVDGQLRLRARLVVKMDGVDTDLYDRCLTVRRKLESELFGGADGGRL